MNNTKVAGVIVAGLIGIPTAVGLFGGSGDGDHSGTDPAAVISETGEAETTAAAEAKLAEEAAAAEAEALALAETKAAEEAAAAEAKLAEEAAAAEAEALALAEAKAAEEAAAVLAAAAAAAKPVLYQAPGAAATKPVVYEAPPAKVADAPAGSATEAAAPAAAAAGGRAIAGFDGLMTGSAYADARAVMVEAGWSPRELTEGTRANPLDADEAALVEAGFAELEGCETYARTVCRFEYLDGKGKIAAVLTAGKDTPTVIDAFVMDVE